MKPGVGSAMTVRTRSGRDGERTTGSAPRGARLPPPPDQLGPRPTQPRYPKARNEDLEVAPKRAEVDADDLVVELAAQPLDVGAEPVERFPSCLWVRQRWSLVPASA